MSHEYIAENFIHAGVRVKIIADQDPMNPREDYDNASVMICFHKNYILGDKHDYRSENYAGWEEMLEAIKNDYDPVVIKPLYLYDHSGITIRTAPFSCPWDSGQVGWVLMPRATALKEWGKKYVTKHVREMAEKCLDIEVETYDQYLTGDVWGYVVEALVRDEDGEVNDDAEGEELDSCWGFFGSEYAMEEAKRAAEYAGKERAEAEKQNELVCEEV